MNVTDKNFEEFYPKIKKSLESAAFIAIDAEFSGLHSGDKNDTSYSNESLFDSPKERYTKLRKNIEPFIAIQFGLTAFISVKHKNTYNAESFEFYLLPKALPTKNRTFLTQATAVQFLTTYKFDFNELTYNALSYLDENEETALHQSLEHGSYAWELSDSGMDDGRNQIEDCFNKVQQWLRNESETLSIEAPDFAVSYRMQKELRASFKTIWTESLGPNAFAVIKVSCDVRESLEKKDVPDELNKQLLDHYIGFSKVFKLMSSLKKPIVGHNLLLDLMFMHKQFYRPLPENYEMFKKNVNRLFPLVYDTKFLSFEMKKILGETSWKSNVLADLYNYYKDGQGRYLAMNSPSIVLSSDAAIDTQKCEEKFHNAAWDSYCTGYCFIRMAHICAVRKQSKDADMRVLTNAEIMSGVMERVNRINLIRADLSHLRLDGPDPASMRPRWLFVRASSNNLTTRRIARAFSRFGSVDVKRFSVNEVLVAVPNHGIARAILKNYEENAEFRVVPYNPLRHSSRTIKAVVWVGSLFLSGAGICAWILHRGGGGGGSGSGVTRG